jgi:hypothetical protein
MGADFQYATAFRDWLTEVSLAHYFHSICLIR